jgi:hypothetical protein
MGTVIVQHFEGSFGHGLAASHLPTTARARLVAGLSNGNLSGIRELPPAIRAPVAAAARNAFAGGVRAAAETGWIVTVTCTVFLMIAWWAMRRSACAVPPGGGDGGVARAGTDVAQARQRVPG